MSPTCLTNPDLAKIKARVEKNFPDNGDLTKIQGFDLFRQSCHDTCTELTFFSDITCDISEFRRAAKDLLKEIPRTIVQVKLDVSRGILTLYLELLVSYIRVMIMFTSIEDRKGIAAMFTSSYFLAKETNEPNLGELSKLLTDSDNIQRLFIDEFSVHSDFIGDCIFQFFESIMAADNCENLRAKYVLNPTSDGDAMGQPARLMLNSRADCRLSMYTELRENHIYAEYVIYAFLACPGLIFHPEGKFTEIFKMVMTDHLVLNVFRDTTLNIHTEFESLYNNFPTKKDAVTVPKGFKIKNILKELSKVAVSSVGMRHLERRSFIRAEIKNLKHILLAVPGLLGPKFPVVLAAASMAKYEILHYFRHLGLDCRKDSKKYLNGDHYKDREISLLVDDLNELTAIVEKHREIIQIYNAEFVSCHDADYLSTLCGQAVAAMPENSNENLTALLLSFAQELRQVDVEQTMYTNLAGVRMNWDRYTTIYSSSRKFSAEANSDLLKFMPEVIERTRMIDSIPILLKKYFVPYELWWYQGRIVDAFREGLELNTRPLCFIGILTFLPMNLHPDCPEEGPLLNDSTSRFCEYLLGLSTKFIESMLKLFWDYFLSLEKKTRAADAGHRLEKLALKQNDQKDGKVDTSTLDRLPGYESEGYNKKSIANLVQNRRSLIALFEQAHNMGSVFVFNKEINVEIAFRGLISTYFEQRIRNTVMSKGDLERPSIVLSEISIGCRVLQTVYDFIAADMSRLLRVILFRNFCEANMPPPGTRFIAPKGSESGLIWKIAQWFTMLAVQASASESGLMWIPSTNSFARAKSSLRPIDVYINREEMASLCGFVGVQGVRCIDNALLSLIMEKVQTVKEFIEVNQTILVEFNRHRYKCSILTGLKSSENFLAASVTVGVALALREALHRGVNDALQSYSPFLHASLTSLSASIRPWILQSVTTPLLSLASDAGILTPSDTTLAQVLRPFVNTPEEKRLFTLLPVAYAAAFMSPYWTSNGNFLPAFEAFRGNQHCLALTISKFLICFIESSSGITEGRPASMPKRKMTIADNGSTLSVALREAADTFLELSANVILAMRIQEEEYMDRTIRPMSNILELFIRYFPLMDRHCLEKYLPYAHIHTSQMDIAMGKIKGADSLANGIHMVMTATSYGNSQLDA